MLCRFKISLTSICRIFGDPNNTLYLQSSLVPSLCYNTPLHEQGNYNPGQKCWAGSITLEITPSLLSMLDFPGRKW